MPAGIAPCIALTKMQTVEMQPQQLLGVWDTGLQGMCCSVSLN